ncbi:MAG: ketoacyl-ACP synthase III [Prevotella sp.]|nr:ketoacyl-ACP synthase III [Prevotella sp.]
MAYYSLPNIKIAAVASAVPAEVVKLEDFADKFGADYVEKYKKQTGVKQFRKTREHQTASDLAFAAAENIINTKVIDRESIGALVFIAHSTDYWRPATACVLHKRLGLKKECAAFDISLACSAVPYGLYALGSMMETSDIDRALLLVGETPQKITNPNDKSSCMLIGEGGGAFLLEKTNDGNAGISGICRSFGQGYNAIIMPGGGFRNPNPPTEDYVWKDGNRRSMYNVMMRGEDVFAFTISDIPKTIKEYLAKIDKSVEEFDCLAFHQANKFILQMLCKKLKVGQEKMPMCLDRYGNTSAASIPMVLGDVYGNNDDAKVINVLMSGFGVGLSWGVCSAKISAKDILPIIESDEIFEEGIINTPEDYYNLSK